MDGARPRGRPKKTWREIVEEDCKAHGLNREDAMDRSRWRRKTGIFDDHNGCEWVNVYSGTGSPGLSRTKSRAVKQLCCVCGNGILAYMYIQNLLARQNFQTHFTFSSLTLYLLTLTNLHYVNLLAQDIQPSTVEQTHTNGNCLDNFSLSGWANSHSRAEQLFVHLRRLIATAGSVQYSSETTISATKFSVLTDCQLPSQFLGKSIMYGVYNYQKLMFVPTQHPIFTAGPDNR